MPARTLRLWQDRVEAHVEIVGAGPPLVFLHGSWGLRADRDFLDRLAATHTVYAPHHPGTGPGDPEAVHQLDTWLDLVVYHGELLDGLGLEGLGLEGPALVGHSFGGMLACELAAALPARMAKLVLIDPIGLWRDDRPVKNWMILGEDPLREGLFADPDGAAARRFFALAPRRRGRAPRFRPASSGPGLHGQVRLAHPRQGPRQAHPPGQGTDPDRVGPRRRRDRARLAEDFARGIAGARVELIDRAGHFPHLEHPERVARLVGDFLSL